MTVRSPAFAHEERIPSKYTCDGEDILPPLAIDGVPQGTVSLALLVDDPDAPHGTWNHLVVCNVAPTTTRIGEGEEPDGVRGVNAWGVLGYGGPCPLEGEHRYLFRVYAFDTTFTLEEGYTTEELSRVMEGHIIETATLMGRYIREKI